MKQNIGIDLGTCNSCVAEYKDKISAALVNNVSKMLTTPSYVKFGEKLLIGEEAKLNVQPDTISSFKRLIGRRFSDFEVQEQIKRVPYQIIDQQNSPMIKINEKLLSSAEVSGAFLKQLKLQTGFQATDVVLTVPAYFTHQQKLETEKAGQLAGLNISRLLAEPTAACLTYDSQNRAALNEYIMVVDLGAGTYDVSVLEKQGDVYQVLACAGNNFYGGDDYTRALQLFLEQNQVKMSFLEAEKLKHELSGGLLQKQFGDKTVKFGDLSKFGQLDSQLEKPILQTLSDASLLPTQINKVLLVGGQTKQPSVQRKIEQIMKQKPLTTLNPDLCVAQGASLQAAILNGDLQSVLLLDATPFSLGIETLNGAFAPVLKRNVTLPAQASQVFTTTEDNQQEVIIRVYQGENQLAARNTLLGEFALSLDEKRPKGVPKIKVEFQIDQNGVVLVKAIDEKTGKEQKIQVKFGKQREEKSEIQCLREELDQMGIKWNEKWGVEKLKAVLKKQRRRQ